MNSNKIKICFIVDYYPPDRLGGVGESACYLKETLKNNGHDVAVLTTGRKSSNQSIEKNVFRLSKNLLFFPLALLFRFPSLYKKYNFDIIHFHHTIGFTVLFWKYFYQKRFPATVFTFKCSRFHIMKSLKNIAIDGKIIAKPNLHDLKTKFTFFILGHLVDRLFVYASDYLTANSNDTREKNIQNYNIPLDKIEIIHNGVDTQIFRSDVDGKPIRKQYNVDDKEVLILYVGGFSIRKRVPLLLYFMQQLKLKSKNLKLMITGTGKGYDLTLKRLASRLGVSKDVIFTGLIKNSRLPFYYAASDMVVVPSEYEPFGIINIEAMAMAKPVIAADVGGISEIIDDGKTGFLVKKDDLNEFTDKITLLAGDKVVCQNIGQKAVERIQRHFQWDDVSQRYLCAYRESLERRSEG